MRASTEHGWGLKQLSNIVAIFDVPNNSYRFQPWKYITLTYEPWLHLLQWYTEPSDKWNNYLHVSSEVQQMETLSDRNF